MATFITTIKFTPQGIREIHDTAKRATSLKTAAKKMGVKVTDIYWTMGDQDGVLIYEAPDDETAAAMLYHLGSHGFVNTSTCRAFSANEVGKILEHVPAP